MQLLLYIAGGYIGIVVLSGLWAWKEMKNAPNAHDLWPDLVPEDQIAN